LACNTPYQTDAGSEILGANDAATIKTLFRRPAGQFEADHRSPADRPAGVTPMR